MNGENKPKLNLRGNTQLSEPVDSEVETLLSQVQSGLDDTEKMTHVSRQTPNRASYLSSDPAHQLRESGSVLRARGKKPQSDIGEVWEDLKQRQIDGDESIFANREIGEVFEKVGATIGDVSKRIKTGYAKASKTAALSEKSPKRRQAASSSHGSARPVHLKTTKLSPAQGDRRGGRFAYNFRSTKKQVSLIAVLMIGLVFALGRGGDSGFEPVQKPEALGAQVISEKVKPEDAQGVLQPVNTTEFDLLFTNGRDSSSIEVVKVSPPENDPVYAYIDTLQGVEIRVSQQAVPIQFIESYDSELEKVATNFQATDIIQIDEVRVYHGVTERFGGVQSLVFIKNDVLIFISSAEVFSDDTWAGYIIGLQ